MDKPPIEAVLEHYGADFVPARHGWASMYCPFHEDRTRSASVNSEEGVFHCFTCDVSGDSYSIIQLKEGIGFRESVEFGASVFGTGDGQLRAVRSAGKRVPGRAGSGHKPRRYVPPGRRGRAGERP